VTKLNKCFVDFLVIKDDLPNSDDFETMPFLNLEEKKKCKSDLEKIEKKLLKISNEIYGKFKKDSWEMDNFNCIQGKMKKFNGLQSLVKEILFNRFNQHEPSDIKIDFTSRAIAFANARKEVRQKIETAQMFCIPAITFGEVFDSLQKNPDTKSIFNPSGGKILDVTNADELKRDYCLLKNAGDALKDNYIHYNFKKNPQKINFDSLDCIKDFIHSSKELRTFLARYLLNSVGFITRDQATCFQSSVWEEQNYAIQLLKAKAAGKSNLEESKRNEYRENFITFMTKFFEKIETELNSDKKCGEYLP
jgi:hypothetical protein